MRLLASRKSRVGRVRSPCSCWLQLSAFGAEGDADRAPKNRKEKEKKQREAYLQGRALIRAL